MKKNNRRPQSGSNETNDELVKDIVIRLLDKNEVTPFELLLDADPSMDAISKYLKLSEVHIALLKGKVIAIFVLYPQSKSVFEIKNIAVSSKFQGKGIGTMLLNRATQIARGKGAEAIVIGTSNASVAQLSLYQRNGFRLTGIRYNFFLDNYPTPIFENEIQCRHMLMLTKTL